jgi:hypothetical protein
VTYTEINNNKLLLYSIGGQHFWTMMTLQLVMLVPLMLVPLMLVPLMMECQWYRSIGRSPWRP